MEKIKVAICDDYEELRHSYKAQFEYYDSIELVGIAQNAHDCIRIVAEKEPDVLLLDIVMETDTEGIDIIPELLEVKPDLKIAMLTSSDDEKHVFSAFANGAVDYIVKSLSFDYIVEKITAIYHNDFTLSSDISQKLVKRSKELEDNQKSLMLLLNNLVKLSTSEFEILKRIYNGDSYKEIARSRFVEEGSVRTLASRILRKLDVKTMQGLIADLKKMRLFEFLD